MKCACQDRPQWGRKVSKQDGTPQTVRAAAPLDCNHVWGLQRFRTSGPMSTAPTTPIPAKLLPRRHLGLQLGGPTMVNFDGLLEAMADLIADKVAKKIADNDTTPVRPRLLTVDQAATFLGRTREAVQHMVSAGKIAVVKSDRRVFLDVRDLEAWIDANKVQGYQ
jgi:excisionase family DNA binding protein